ncbi:MAG: 30S ribosomal protein S4 [Elusimicrobia bacterium]|nr:30S ribosomal protein S4 [Elusimicrobiota bacterium]MDE2237621.1 30S ribosomal protein S4 [Elusimicrobiota bacterium]MDE2425336.1 30S ribosomal protein S4 [Elusimicrobiota bacterium]
MSRYIESVCKLCRREQTKLFLKGEKCYTKCVLEKRPTTPGMAKPQRGKPSAYAIRLREKQKLRHLVSMNEKAFEVLVNKASKARESSGDHLLRSLELRLDNVVRRMGVATSLKTARQLVLHGHVKVDGKPVNIPSYACEAGQTVALSPKLKENVGVKLSLDTAKRLNQRPAFGEWKEDELSFRILRQPERAEMSFPVTEQLIIEYYSK